jgi:hypothetical protein
MQVARIKENASSKNHRESFKHNFQPHPQLALGWDGAQYLLYRRGQLFTLVTKIILGLDLAEPKFRSILRIQRYSQ